LSESSLRARRRGWKNKTPAGLRASRGFFVVSFNPLRRDGLQYDYDELYEPEMIDCEVRACGIHRAA